MRKKFLRVQKSLISLFLCFILLFSYFAENIALAYVSDFGTTFIFHNEERTIAEGVVLNRWSGRNGNDSNKTGQTITFNPKTSDAMIIAAYGNSVASRATLSSMSKIEEQKHGASIIGGINGDFYYTENGVPIGLLIQNGKLISYSNTKWNAVGFKQDGTVVIDMPNLEMYYEANGKKYSFGNFNKNQNDWGPYLYSSDFGPNTGSNVPSLEVILDIIEGDLKIGGAVRTKITGIKINAKATPIGENQLVLSAKNGKSGFSSMADFRMGDEIVFHFNDPENKWTNVNQAVGGERILIDSGAIVSGLPTSNYNPSTAVGVKANGEVVFYQVDGRSSLSQGVSSTEVAQFLYKLGCVKALQLDGGGSSAIIARLPGHSSPGLLNNPSDGRERANSNSLILASKHSVAVKEGEKPESTEAKKLHVYPGKVYTLPKAMVQYSVLATNEHYLPAKLPEPIDWVTGTGTIDEKGNLTVGEVPGNYYVMAYKEFTTGSSSITVLDNVTSLKPSKSVITLLPGDVIDLDCEAYYYNIKVNSTDRSFNWQVEGNIGTITQDGVFTMAENAVGDGRIVVKYGNTAAYIDVVIPATPNAIEDFESAIEWGYSTVRTKSANVSIIQDKEMARSGSGLLKLDYDFTLGAGVEKGVAGVYAFMLDPNTKEKTELTINREPVAIGMWVYGDNSKTWLRASVKDGSGQSFYIDFTPEYKPVEGTGGIDWIGWKYVEAKMPSGRKGPFTLETPIRVMCSRDEMRTKGTLYFDQIRAVYTGDDIVQAPVVKITSPADKAVIKTGRFPLTAEIIKGANAAAIDQNSVKVMLDGAELTNLSIEGTDNVLIKGELGSEINLADGYHSLTVNFSDMAGNKGTHTITFTVDAGAPQVIAKTDSTVVEGGSFATTIDIKNPKNLKKIYVDFEYDTEKIEPVDQDSSAPGIQPALETWAAKGNVIANRIDEKNGRVLIVIDNLTNLSTADASKLCTVTFRAKATFGDETTIKLHLGAMIVGDSVKSQRFILPEMKVSLDYPLLINAEGINPGETTTITVTDTSGNPVEGAEIYLNDLSFPFWQTDKNGQAVTSILTQLLDGNPLSIRAKKGDLKSKPFVLAE
ncbi:MAG: phosphodiester glycosidase family protein [Acetivibrionales bacterium]|jgi:exopolysaccharide biosynthesis protein